MAHRGGAGLAPENTLEAFRSAVEVWRADVLEMDVRCTRDGRLVVLHDETLERTTDRPGPVAELQWTEVRKCDAGACWIDADGARPFAGRGIRVPLLDEILEEFPRTRLNVEVKCAEAAPVLADVVRRHGAHHRVLVAATDESDRRALRGYPGPWGASRRDIARFRLLRRIPFFGGGVPPVDVFQIPERWGAIGVLSRRLVEDAHRFNIPVHVWTVDDPDDMRRFLGWGVDGIQSDRPDLLARVLAEETERPLPPGLLEGSGGPRGDG